jgi:hypothetical protein
MTIWIGPMDELGRKREANHIVIDDGYTAGGDVIVVRNPNTD